MAKMREFKVVKASVEHLREILTHLSEEDIAECTLGLGPNFREVLLGHAHELRELTALVSQSGITFAIGGVQENNIVWMLTSQYMHNLTKMEKRQVFTIMHTHLKQQLAIHGYLINRVHENTVSHIKFLEGMGAQFGQKDENGWIHFVLR